MSSGPSGTPGGFTAVVRAESFGAAGGVLRTNIGAIGLEILISAHTFGGGRVEVEIMRADLAALGHALPRLGLREDRVITGFGVSFLGRDGAEVPSSRFEHEVRIVLKGAALSGPLHVFDLAGRRKAHLLKIARLRSDEAPAKIAVAVRGSEDIFAVVASRRRR